MGAEHKEDGGLSLHGEGAARRQATGELLFFASVGDVERCTKLMRTWNLNVADPACHDYDRRTPLHLAAAEGCHSLVQWLLEEHHVDPNPVDRFKRTPLEDAVRGDHKEVGRLLMAHGAKVLDRDGVLVDLSESHLSLNISLLGEHDLDIEIDPKDITFVSQLGEGEFGIVHKALWHGTVVAVKILKQHTTVALGDFRTELNVLQKVHHPHTVQFLGAVTRSQPFMIVTEFMAGGSLSDVFKSGIKLSNQRSVELALDCARGMSYLHRRSPHCVIHRDLKPANLMVGGHSLSSSSGARRMIVETGCVKIADFGLSRSIKTKLYTRHAQRDLEDIKAARALGNRMMSKDSLSEMTETYQMTGETGSYRYMAPEVFRHERYNSKVDVYAFAMICYQLFEGLPPFWEYDPVMAARAAAVEKQRPLWGYVSQHGQRIPDKMRKLIEDCWAEDFEKRPDFGEITERLQDIWNDLEKKKSDKRGKCCCVQ
ncbi:unnamed protein product [Ostreobium quekettii]|uniref:Protein kinase domain-containing protein n=1 Tax=Ostreobium quekettii TaxID=121088 RepID=A0A8S1J3I8_9CHLO|nr:unnamed protein product [Ostreobium quekettii]|eukprot:evm.model.scf_1158.3 EVM.evm.TU.scf_1158.3   scf_1158:43701-48588(+)